MVGGENNSIRQPVLGTPLDRGGWFLREHNIKVVTRVNKVNAVSCIILWVSFVINNSGTEISVIPIALRANVYVAGRFRNRVSPAESPLIFPIKVQDSYARARNNLITDPKELKL